jgi:nicotinate-nucleotide pyrophosphorylase (carboxylating)
LSSDAAPASDRAALSAAFEQAIAAALREDLGSAGAEADITTVSTVVAGTFGEGTVIAKQHGVVAGLEALSVTFGQLDDRVEVELLMQDGNPVRSGEKLAIVRGPARAILTGERTALNLLGHLSGIATLANAFVQKAPEATIVETRKTLPGLRALEKYAVTCGGASNHRFSLWDGVLIKDNHIVAVGGIGEAVRRARKATTLPVQVECATRDDVLEAIGAGAPSLLLDNRTPDELRELVELIRERAPDTLIEASGGIALDNVDAIASTGVDRISIGALTHSAPALDVSLNLEKTWTE